MIKSARLNHWPDWRSEKAVKFVIVDTGEAKKVRVVWKPQPILQFPTAFHFMVSGLFGYYD
jgi:hypothetical protein